MLGAEMTANVSIWIRAFRSPLQRAYTRLDKTDRDLADLLRQADERIVKASSVTDENSRPRAR
jgi:hypothetical protein